MGIYRVPIRRIYLRKRGAWRTGQSRQARRSPGKVRATSCLAVLCYRTGLLPSSSILRPWIHRVPRHRVVRKLHFAYQNFAHWVMDRRLPRAPAALTEGVIAFFYNLTHSSARMSTRKGSQLGPLKIKCDVLKLRWLRGGSRSLGRATLARVRYSGWREVRTKSRSTVTFGP